MILFLLKGLLRDRSRSKFPFLVITSGAALTVLMFCWLNGVLDNMLEANAKFDTGHVKIMSRAYAAEADQMPNELALLGVDSLLATLHDSLPDMYWTPRIRFVGLLDIPDAGGETRAQGPAFGLAVNLLDSLSREPEILKLGQSLVRGRLPEKTGEVLVSDLFAEKLGVAPGAIATLLSSTMYGSMTTYNFTIVGTIRFGITGMDRGAVIADLSDIRAALDMHDAASEILGFFAGWQYHDRRSVEIAHAFNRNHAGSADEFAPAMVALREQNGLGELLDLLYAGISIIVAVFLFVMFMVLWNAGLMGSLRRYGEIGVRLAIGEDRGHLYRSMLYEALLLGVIGSIAGTAIGLAVSYYLQHEGINFGIFVRSESLMMSSVVRARVTPLSFFIGFLPGLGATFFGTMVSGIGIYKRQTSQLFKELEV